MFHNTIPLFLYRASCEVTSEPKPLSFEEETFDDDAASSSIFPQIQQIFREIIQKVKQSILMQQTNSRSDRS